MAQLLIHSFSSHISSQGTACAIVAPASAGTDGRGTHVKSGWGPSTERCAGGEGGVERVEEERGGEKEAQAARSNRRSGASRHLRTATSRRYKHGCNSAYRNTAFILFLVLSTNFLYKTECWQVAKQTFVFRTSLGIIVDVAMLTCAILDVVTACCFSHPRLKWSSSAWLIIQQKTL